MKKCGLQQKKPGGEEERLAAGSWGRGKELMVAGEKLMEGSSVEGNVTMREFVGKIPEKRAGVQSTGGGF